MRLLPFFPFPQIDGTDGFTEGAVVTKFQLLSGKKISFAGVPSLPIMLVVSSSFPNLCSTGGRNALPCDSTDL